jgi:uncharacterized membrane protein YbhN (UPF0104 family)
MDTARARGPGGALRPAFLAKLAVTLLCLGFVARRVNGALLWHSLRALDPLLLLVAFPAFLLFGVLGGMRWWMVMRQLGQPARLGNLTAIFWAGMALNQFLPAAAGDAGRAVLCIRAGARTEPVIASIVLERVFMVIALLVMVVATQPLLGKFAPGMSNMRLALLLLAAGLGGCAVLASADLGFPILRRFAATRWMAALAASSRRVMAPRNAAPLFIVSLIGNVNFIVAAWLLAIALGMGGTFGLYVAVMPVVVAVTVLPVSVGGWGLREGVMVAMLGHAGVPADTALALSVLFGAMSAAASLPGVIPLWQRSHRGAAA